MPLVYVEDRNTTQDRRTKSKKEAGSKRNTKNGRYKLSTEENLVSSFFTTTDYRILNL